MNDRESWQVVQSKLAVRKAYYKQIGGRMESSTANVCIILQEVVPFHNSPSKRYLRMALVIIISSSILPTKESAILANSINLRNFHQHISNQKQNVEVG